MSNKLYFLINSLEGGGAETVLIRLKEYLKPTKIFLIQNSMDERLRERRKNPKLTLKRKVF